MKRLIFASVLLLGGNVCLAERSIQECKDGAAVIGVFQRKMNTILTELQDNGRAQKGVSRAMRDAQMISAPVTRDPKKSELAFRNIHQRRKTV